MAEGKKKLGRPRKGNELKSETLAIKTSAALKERLATEARVKRRSLTEEVETRLTESLDRSEIPRTERTAKLLEEIARNIHEIEMALGENDEPARWHENLAVWAAVREMLYHGPVAAVATGDAFRVEKLERLTDEANQIREAKGQFVVVLEAFGIEADLERRRHLTLGDFMRGEASTPNRDSLRMMANNIQGLTDPQRQTALAAIDALEKLDAAEEQNEEARAAAVEFLREGIERGRATYIKPPRDPALDHAIDLLRQADIGSRLRHSQLSIARGMAALAGNNLLNLGGATKRNDDSIPAADDAG